MNDHIYADLLQKALVLHTHKPCMHIKRGGQYATWTYDDFRRDINRLVSAMKLDNLLPGSTCLVIGDNTPEWVIAWHCGFLSGGKTVPVDPNLPAEEIREIVAQTKPSIVFCSRGFIKLFEELKAEEEIIKRIVVLDNSYVDITIRFKTYLSSGDAESNAFSRIFAKDDITTIIFTSGTTGKAKGVLLTQQNFTAISLDAIPRMQVDANDTMLAVLPLHHVFGACANIAAALTCGLDIVLIPTVKGSLIMDGLREKNVSVLPAVPKMLSLFYNSILQNVKAKGFIVRMVFTMLFFISATLGELLGKGFRRKLFSSVHKNFGGKLNIIISGGAAIQKKYFNGFKLMGFTIVEGYGLSETFGAITLCPPQKPRIGSVGLPLAGNEVRIDAPNSEGVGEVCFKGETVFAGYYNNKEVTDKSFDKDGWFHTGDLGRIDKTGYLYLCGRIKDVIVLESGKNVYPDELEDYYSRSVLIEEVGVFSAQLKGKEIAAALIVPAMEIRKTNALPQSYEIIRNEVLRISHDLPSYKKITDFCVVYDPLPQTTTKKLKKHELRELYYAIKEKSGTNAKHRPTITAMEKSIMETQEYQAIASCIKQLAQKNSDYQVLPHFLLELDLGLDSLKQLELVCMIERKYRIEFPDEVLVKIDTAGDVYSFTMEQLASQKVLDYGEPVSCLRQRIVGAKSSVTYPENPVNGFLSAIPFITYSASSAYWKVTTTGNNSFPANTPLVFCANRQSQFDPMWILFSLPPDIRKNTFLVGGKDIVQPILFSQLFQNVIPLKQENDIVSKLRLSISVIKDNKNLLVFPESGTTITGELRQFKSGIGLLVQETNCTVIPTKVSGALHVWPSNGLPELFGARKKAPAISFGTPVTFQSLIAANKITPYSTADQISECIRDIVSGM